MLSLCLVNRINKHCVRNGGRPPHYQSDHEFRAPTHSLSITPETFDNNELIQPPQQPPLHPPLKIHYECPEDDRRPQWRSKVAAKRWVSQALARLWSLMGIDERVQRSFEMALAGVGVRELWLWTKVVCIFYFSGCKRFHETWQQRKLTREEYHKPHTPEHEIDQRWRCLYTSLYLASLLYCIHPILRFIVLAKHVLFEVAERHLEATAALPKKNRGKKIK